MVFASLSLFPKSQPPHGRPQMADQLGSEPDFRLFLNSGRKREGEVFRFQRESTGVWNVWSGLKVHLKATATDSRSKAQYFVRYPTMSPRGNQIAYESTESTGNIWMIEFK